MSVLGDMHKEDSHEAIIDGVDRCISHATLQEKYFAREQLRKTITCPICLDYLQHPLSLSCGHAYCKVCIEEAYRHTDLCPVCNRKFSRREFVAELQTSPLLIQQLASLLEAMPMNLPPPIQSNDTSMPAFSFNKEFKRPTNSAASQSSILNFTVRDHDSNSNKSALPAESSSSFSGDGKDSSCKGADNVFRKSKNNASGSISDAAASRNSSNKSKRSKGRKRKRTTCNSHAHIHASNTGTSTVDAEEKDAPPKRVFAVGDLVEVQARTWIGVNKPGGTARVLAMVEKQDEEAGRTYRLYDLKHVLDGHLDAAVHEVFVSEFRELARASRRTRPMEERNWVEIDSDDAFEAYASNPRSDESGSSSSEDSARSGRSSSSRGSSDSENDSDYFKDYCTSNNEPVSSKSKMRAAPLRKGRGSIITEAADDEENIKQRCNAVDRPSRAGSSLQVAKRKGKPVRKKSRVSTFSFDRESDVVLLTSSVKPAVQTKIQALILKEGGGRIKLATAFNSDVTHLVVSLDKGVLKQRTIKYLQAIMAGVWIVSADWITDSLRSNALQAESGYEVTRNAKAREEYAPHRARSDRELAAQERDGGEVEVLYPPHRQPRLIEGPRTRLFKGLVVLLQGDFALPGPPRSELEELVRMGAGMVVTAAAEFWQLAYRRHLLSKIQLVQQAQDGVDVLIHAQRVLALEDAIMDKWKGIEHMVLVYEGTRVRSSDIQLSPMISSAFTAAHEAVLSSIGNLNGCGASSAESALHSQQLLEDAVHEAMHCIDANQVTRDVQAATHVWILDSVANFRLQETSLYV